MYSLRKTIFWLTFFSIAMGYMEAAVVVYVRKIYYPGGFNFPLVPIDADVAFTEIFRELATMIMLLGVGLLGGKTPSSRFALFLFCFAIWDIFYYVFLKVLIDWPSSLFTWDVLFLIPVPWVGPVIAPVIISMTMILLTLCVILFQAKGKKTGMEFIEIGGFVLGSLILIYSFVIDYIHFVYGKDATSTIMVIFDKKKMFEDVAEYIPTIYSWTSFVLGESILLASIAKYVNRIRK